MLEDKVKKLTEEFRELSKFHKDNAEDFRNEWQLNAAQMSINMYHSYSYFVNKLEELLK